MTSKNLLASSGSQKGIIQLIAEYFCDKHTDRYRLDGENIIQDRVTGDHVLTGFRVIKKKGRYRFEMVIAET